MLNPGHFRGDGNLRIIARENQALGRALIEFGRMIEDGRAGDRPVSQPPPPYQFCDFPMHGSWEGAKHSLKRAQSQHAKGRVSDDELAQIRQRYLRAVVLFNGGKR